MRLLFFVSLFLITFVAQAGVVCDKDDKDWKLQASKREIVFSAKVIGWKDSGRLLKVIKTFRGKVPILVKTLPDSVEIGGIYPNANFEANEEYLFSIDKLIQSEEGEMAFSPSICSPPIRSKDNKKLIKWLQSADYKSISPKK